MTKSSKRYWGIFGTAVAMFFLGWIGGAVTGRMGVSAVTMLWLLIAYFALRGNVKSIRDFSLVSIAIQLIAMVVVVLVGGQDFLEIVTGAAISIAVWLAVYFRASVIDKSTAGVRHSSQDETKDLSTGSPGSSTDMAVTQRERSVVDDTNLISSGHILDTPPNQSQEGDISQLFQSTFNTVLGAPSSKQIAKTQANFSATDGTTEPRTADNAPEGKWPNAFLAISYRPEVKAAWEEAQSLPDSYKQTFLVSLDADPNGDPQGLLRELQDEWQKEQRPFDTEAANDAFEEAGTISVDAALEFRRVYPVLKESVPPDVILSRIEDKHGPGKARLQRAKEEAARIEAERRKHEWRTLIDGLGVGIYSVGTGKSFRVSPDGTVYAWGFHPHYRHNVPQEFSSIDEFLRECEDLLRASANDIRLKV